MFISYMDVSVSDGLDCCVAGDEDERTAFLIDEEEGGGDDTDTRFVGNTDGSLVCVVGVAGFDMELLIGGAFNEIAAVEEFVIGPDADNEEEAAVDGRDSFASVNDEVKVVGAVALDASFWAVELAATRDDVDKDTPFDFFGVLEEAATLNGGAFAELVFTTAVGGVGVGCGDETDDSAFCLLFLRKPTFTTPVAV